MAKHLRLVHAVNRQSAGNLPAASYLGLRDLRLRAGLTQEDLADGAGVSVRSISDIERGRNLRPFAGTLRRLADGLGLDQESRAAFMESSLRVAGGSVDRADVRVPAPLTRLVGRGPDVESVLRILAEGKSRLLVLTGPGGVGKTRLALEVGWRAGDLFETVDFVGLASLAAGQAVLPLVARALGSARDQKLALDDSLAMVLAGRRALLILDNFEHVVPSAGEIGRLLSLAPRLCVLCTSRSLMHVYGERVYEIKPLGALVEHDDESSEQALSESAQLFADRLRLLRPDFRLDKSRQRIVESICARLDGLPLAIEMAAARAHFLSLEAVLDGIDRSRLRLTAGSVGTADTRHSSLNAVIGWSYELLTEPERALFRALSVFRGGLTPEAAAAVVNGDPDSVRVSIVALTDMSLVQRSDDEGRRFGLLETIREYARVRLDEAGEARVKLLRHADYFAAWLRDLHAEESDVEWEEYFGRQATEQPNIEAAMEFCREAGEDRLAFEILSLDLGYRWQTMPGMSWPAWSAGLQELPEGLQGAVRTRIELLACASGERPAFALRDASRTRALEAGIEALALREDQCLRVRMLTTVGFLVTYFWHESSGGEAKTLGKRYLAKASEIARDVTRGRLAGELLRARAEASKGLGTSAGIHDYSRLLGEALDTERQRGDSVGIAYSLHGLGSARFWQGRNDEALDRLEEAARRYRDAGLTMNWADAAALRMMVAVSVGRHRVVDEEMRSILSDRRLRPYAGAIMAAGECLAYSAAARGLPREAALLGGALRAYRHEGGAVVGHLDDRSPTGWDLVERETRDDIWPAAFIEASNRFVRAMKALGGRAEYGHLLEEGSHLSLEQAVALIVDAADTPQG
ncbi:MAG TPA: helix-turn-helix domain-containing protein [Chloroflexota bacterium]|nr:helix-turn-helix domain-containing protein [Chloroflexota bacterium]